MATLVSLSRQNISKTSLKRASPAVGAAAPGRGRCARRAKPVRAVADFVKVGSKEAILCQRFSAHSAAVSSVLVFEDAGDNRQVITSSLDKTVALWKASGCDELCGGGFEEASRLAPPGGPVFSLLRDDRTHDGQPNQAFLGCHARSIAAWVPPSHSLEPQVQLGEHCGWVRALASSQGRWLFSCACSTLYQWDMARAVPRLVTSVTLDKGDILCLAASKGAVFTGGTDGSIRSWAVGKKGELVEAVARPGAHSDRVTSLALFDGRLFSVSYDGSVRAWDAASLEPVADVRAAHDGGRLHCAVVGPDGRLYTGGDDQLVRRWAVDALVPAAAPLYAHNHSVRTLAAGPGGLLVSGDKGGEVAVWAVV